MRQNFVSTIGLQRIEAKLCFSSGCDSFIVPRSLACASEAVVEPAFTYV